MDPSPSPALAEARADHAALARDLVSLRTALTEADAATAAARRQGTAPAQLAKMAGVAGSLRLLVGDQTADLAAARALLDRLEAEAAKDAARARYDAAQAQVADHEAWYVAEGEDMLARLCTHVAAVSRALGAWREAAVVAVRAHAELAEPTVPAPKVPDLARVPLRMPEDFAPFAPPTFVLDGTQRRTGAAALSRLPEIAEALVRSLMLGAQADRPIPARDPKEDAA
jgi:hypothetical protein